MVTRKAEPSPQGTVRDSIGAHMRDLRKRRKMTLEQLSDLTGISVSSLSRIENTRLGLSIDKVEKLARALGVTPETFVSRERPGRAPPSSARSQAANPGEARFLVDRAAERQANAYRELNIEYLFDGGPGAADVARRLGGAGAGRSRCPVAGGALRERPVLRRAHGGHRPAQGRTG